MTIGLCVEAEQAISNEPRGFANRALSRSREADPGQICLGEHLRRGKDVRDRRNRLRKLAAAPRHEATADRARCLERDLLPDDRPDQRLERVDTSRRSLPARAHHDRPKHRIAAQHGLVRLWIRVEVEQPAAALLRRGEIRGHVEFKRRRHERVVRHKRDDPVSVS